MELVNDNWPFGGGERQRLLLNRRWWLKSSAGAILSPGLLASDAVDFKAVAFDAFAVLDPRPIAAMAEKLYPGHGARLIEIWRARQFEYTWLRTLTNTWVDFHHVTAESLAYAARAAGVPLTEQVKRELVGCYYRLPPWPDAAEVLHSLRRSGVRLVFLSNLTQEMLARSAEASSLQGLFEHLLSTDRVRAFKPDPRAYRMAVDALRLPKEQIVFAAFAGWDVAGAKAFGYPTVWVNRTSALPEELGAVADLTGSGLQDVMKFVQASRRGRS